MENSKTKPVESLAPGDEIDLSNYWDGGTFVDRWCAEQAKERSFTVDHLEIMPRMVWVYLADFDQVCIAPKGQEITLV